MSDRGYFAVDRGFWVHPLFAREKFSEREAWIWLISAAAWEPRRARIGRASFDLDRGQLVAALRFLAEKWRWSEPRVRRFLKRLTDDAAVLVLATREATLITICNYDKYQSSRRTDDVASDAALDAKPTNPRRKDKETNQGTTQATKKTEGRARRGARLPDDWVPNETERAFAEGRLPVVRVETEALKFRNYWTSKSGSSAIKINWSRTWENWILNATEG